MASPVPPVNARFPHLARIVAAVVAVAVLGAAAGITDTIEVQLQLTRG